MPTLKSLIRHEYAIPNAPCLYVNDPSDGATIVERLTQLIPRVIHLSLSKPDCQTRHLETIQARYHRDAVVVFSDYRSDDELELKKTTSAAIREAAIKASRNFASVNFYLDEKTAPAKLSANHIDLLLPKHPESVTSTEAQEFAEKVYRWLFTVLNVKETVHLISDAEMSDTSGSTASSGFEYCAITNQKRRKPDAKIQFVAIVTKAATVVSRNRVMWQIADKTAVATFLYTWRNPASQQTWDWVLQLKVGQRTCFPRMPCVKVKENLITTIAKVPVRIPGKALEITGNTLGVLSKGVQKLGSALQMGPRKRWVHEADVAQYLKKHHNVKVVPSKEKKTIKVFTENGEKTWSDANSSRSTLCGDAAQEKTESYKENCAV